MVPHTKETPKEATNHVLFVIEEPIEDRLERAIERADEVILTNEAVLADLGFKPYADVVGGFI